LTPDEIEQVSKYILSKRVNDYRERVRANSISDAEEVKKWIQSVAVKSTDAPYLELRFDEAEKLVLLQGNQSGLEQIYLALTRLTHDSAIPGSHWQFDATNMIRSDLDLIIQHVNGSGGTHVVE